jgi:enamine deaminase RidA (YjgF/YER057c/UK114 family)
MPVVQTSTPPGAPAPIGPHSHVAKVGSFVTVGGTAGVDPATAHRPARMVVAMKELPRPGVLLTMNLTAVTRD